jgi:hypothetical protein
MGRGNWKYSEKTRPPVPLFLPQIKHRYLYFGGDTDGERETKTGLYYKKPRRETLEMNQKATGRNKLTKHITQHLSIMQRKKGP